MKLSDLKKIQMPSQPGVYFFYSGKKILYIGKATSLRDRVRSYFARDLIETRGAHIVDMVFKANDIAWQETDTVLEALILEASLIKKYQPYYNTKEKDDKSFNYVCITKEPLPQVLVIRGKEIDFEHSVAQGYKLREFFGPFTHGLQLREAMKIIRRIFPYIDAHSSQKANYEFYKQLGLTPNVEGELKDVENMYAKNIHNLQLFFKGKKKEIVRNLKRDMNAAAKEMNFERAGELKRQLFALMHINDIALLKNENLHHNTLEGNAFRIEAYDVAHMSGKNMVGVMVVLENGEVNKNEYRKFKIKTQKDANDTGALKEMLSRRLNHTEWRFPDVMVIDGSTAQIHAAERVLQERDVSIEIVAVTKDDRHKAKDIKGNEHIIKAHKKEILLANSEAHRFAITYHKQMRNKNFLR
jgi:excinuclease ABC subunit C